MATYGKRRALGQHFLRNAEIARQIADEAVDQAIRHKCPGIMEIGPGKGALTLPLLDRLRQTPAIHSLLIVEKDRQLAERWKVDAEAVRAEGQTSLIVEESDFLEILESTWLKSRPLGVVSNLPYSSGTAILDRLARCTDIPVMVLMFQKEVAQRLRAEPSTKAQGSLSVWIQNRWDVQKFLDVPPRAFLPPPDVDSEVVILTRRSNPQVAGTDDPAWEPIWEKLLKACFSQRRKMLRSGLFSRHPWQNALAESGVDATKRAEALRWQEWDQIFQAVRRLGGLVQKS